MDQIGGIELVILYICAGWAVLLWLLALILPKIQYRPVQRLWEEANARELERAREVAHRQQERVALRAAAVGSKQSLPTPLP